VIQVTLFTHSSESDPVLMWWTQ